MDKISKSEGKVIRGRLKDILLDNGFVLQPSPFGLSEELLAQEGIVRNMNNNDVIKLDCGTKAGKESVAGIPYPTARPGKVGRLS